MIYEELTLQRDQAPPEPVADPARLFPDDLEVPDHTAPSVTEGVRHESGVTGTFAGSLRHEYALPLWPDVVFVVNEHPDGYAWGFGFEGGPAALPAELASVEPWRWTAERLRLAATSTEVLDEWSFDLDAILTFANGARFRARFDLGLLQTWEPPDR